LNLTSSRENALFDVGVLTLGDLMNWGLDRIYFIKGSGELTVKKIKNTVLKDMCNLSGKIVS
jgi:hypothetical protein